MMVLKNTKPKKRKANIEHKDSGKAFNCLFMTPPNMEWFNYVVINWLPDLDKPLVFLPCGMAESTRNSCIVVNHEKQRQRNGNKHVFVEDKTNMGYWGYKPLKKETTSDMVFDPRKFISKGTGHDFMSRITRSIEYCLVILSEPLTVIPYSLEGHPLRPDYNLPVEELSIQSEQIFVRQLALILSVIARLQPERKYIYYCGSLHHYFILYFANRLARNPFKIVPSIAKNGRTGLSECANYLADLITLYEHGNEVKVELPTLDEMLTKRGSYTPLRFWRYVAMMEHKGEDWLQHKEEATKKGEWKRGFSHLYQQDMGATA